ncbi:MAG: hypothetical protein IJB58_08165 [Bacteroidales bacterium]|nr:hypothetical protein [Bacteroidales bacterium]
MAYRKFGTCFFERYAQLTLETILGDRFAGLVNMDRPDLQSKDGRLGIEVTRAMEPNKKNANQLLKELAGMEIKEEQRNDLQSIVESGYAYGLPGLDYTGAVENDYWALALPLKRILKSKIEKVAKGFYGNFDHFELYVFCRDLLDMSQVEAALSYTLELQDNLDLRFETLYLSQTDTLYVCNLKDNKLYEGIDTKIDVYAIPDAMRRDLFFKSLKPEHEITT